MTRVGTGYGSHLSFIYKNEQREDPSLNQILNVYYS